MAKNYFNSKLPLPKIKKSFFNLPSNRKLSVNMGFLYPLECVETLPGDRFRLSSDCYIKLAPMLFPIMHRVKVRLNYFFVPIRLILGEDNTNFLSANPLSNWPAISFNGPEGITFYKNFLLDFFGFQPTPNAQELEQEVIIHNPMPIFMYLKIWLDYYADENLDATTIHQVENLLEAYKNLPPDTVISASELGLARVLTEIRPVSYNKDYFTAAIAEPQNGNDVYLMNPLRLINEDGDLNPGSGSAITAEEDGLMVDNGTQLGASLTITQLWEKMAIQRWYNTSAMFGGKGRYNETLAGHYGVISSDARLQRSQFIGGGQSLVQISEVLQTSATNSDSPLGNYAGRGAALTKTRYFGFFSEEHGFIIPVISIVPENGYMTGWPNWAFKKNFFDLATPEFNNVAEQPIKKGEIFFDYDNPSIAEEDFAYQLRYSEYRQLISRAVGDFRQEPLKSWHLNREFTQTPAFNSSFIHVNSRETARIFADTEPNDMHLYVDCYHDFSAFRPISYIPNPNKL